MVASGFLERALLRRLWGLGIYGLGNRDEAAEITVLCEIVVGN